MAAVPDSRVELADVPPIVAPPIDAPVSAVIAEPNVPAVAAVPAVPHTLPNDPAVPNEPRQSNAAPQADG
ncbi:hypothetical protein GCM10010862_12080 [Devosia nitrariae]|uniref:Uncharacterized protein n=1 Tax=Devosia nitrariae TaxID=2071872 RepID=A0ABQ5W1J7_9HYPH|nr:hypothetical protein GCM10010862_12080 [Devosia nitrariae]